ncbi:MAG: hypothetical protein ACR2GD_03645 [Pyrinomonadaceae bacterium]
MNSEELEISLRTEFETYLKNVFAEMRQEISQLQARIETELENHKTQLDGVFKEALSRADSAVDFDAGFKESVVEHLRQARDEGARITATAIAEAEEMEKQSVASTAGIKELHAAVSDISSKGTQAEILKTLVQHASEFAPRGAFFIIKNEHFVGWRTFGSADDGSEEAVREVFLPISSDSVLSEAVRSLATVESNSETFADDAAILNKLNFGSPDKMFAVPLVARGRGVAVLYADYGTGGGEVNIEALETMVHVAGLTVEVLASSRGASPRKKAAPEQTGESVSRKPAKETVQAETGFAPAYHVPVAEPSEAHQYQSSFDKPNDSSYSEQTAKESRLNEPPEMTENEHQDFVSDNFAVVESGAEKDFNKDTASTYENSATPVQTEESYPTYQDGGWNHSAETGGAAAKEKTFDYEPPLYEKSSGDKATENQPPMISAQEYADNFVKEADDERFPNYSFQTAAESEPQPEQDFSSSSAQSAKDYQIEKPSSESFETFAPETYAPVAPEANSFESASSAKTSESFAKPVAAPPVSAPPVRSRFSERNVDLPIEVSEDERRLHNDARRFARLLVSEIKLYNEQKVKEGREANDLYERLREAIDRSREMYDKRVQPPVAAKFDYFHYELVNTLAENDSNKLGASYPGASV